MLASMGAGGVAGAIGWNDDIGPVRGFVAGGLLSAFSAGMGALSGGFGVFTMGVLGAGREMVLDLLRDQ